MCGNNLPHIQLFTITTLCFTLLHKLKYIFPIRSLRPKVRSNSLTKWAELQNYHTYDYIV